MYVPAYHVADWTKNSGVLWLDQSGMKKKSSMLCCVLCDIQKHMMNICYVCEHLLQEKVQRSSVDPGEW
ncbi:hypothetical protein MHYP_G00310180 [Metynnis hypsauchen]